MNHRITANVASNLYWLGRHLERIEVLLIETLQAYDQIIDVYPNAGKKVFTKLGVELGYKNASEFMSEAVFGDHNANIQVLMAHARENAIISRAHLDFEAFGEIIQLHHLCEHASKSAESTSYLFIDDALSLIDEIWGGLLRREQHKTGDYFIQLGKSIEKVDFHLRLGGAITQTQEWLAEIDSITAVLAPNTTFNTIELSEPYSVIEAVNDKINHIVQGEQ